MRCLRSLTKRPKKKPRQPSERWESKQWCETAWQRDSERGREQIDRAKERETREGTLGGFKRKVKRWLEGGGGQGDGDGKLREVNRSMSDCRNQTSWMSRILTFNCLLEWRESCRDIIIFYIITHILTCRPHVLQKWAMQLRLPVYFLFYFIILSYLIYIWIHWYIHTDR